MHVRPGTAGLVLALGLAVLPAAAGELIRYRTPDGAVGFVDDEKRLPPGVEVVSRTPIERSAPPPAAPAAAAEPAAIAPAGEPSPPGADPTGAAPTGDADCEAIANPLVRTRCRSAREQRCGHYGLSPRCAPAAIASAREWCARSEALRAEIASVDDEHDAARERHANCLRRRTWARSCDTVELEEAARTARAAERRVEALEAQCHDEGCLPGWVREGCAFEPGGA